MSRLIDAEIAYDKIAEQETSYYMDMEGVQAGLDETPTVDAVEVVRCKDCKWWAKDYDICRRGNRRLSYENDWCCAHGERRDSMSENLLCTDNRYELIAEAKKRLIEATNIE